jgi:GTP-binding protein
MVNGEQWIMAEMIIKARFLKSSTDPDGCPPPVRPEFAFAGRSNVGKSSLINYLCNRKNLARTSATPGKTLLINHYLINEEYYLADLPGYGYAQTSKRERERILELIFRYLRTRESLTCLFLLIDARTDPQDNDRFVINWLGQAGIPFAMAFTKTDKLSKTSLDKKLATYREVLMESWEELPPFFLTSALKRSGREKMLEFINNNLKI